VIMAETVPFDPDECDVQGIVAYLEARKDGSDG